MSVPQAEDKPHIGRRNRQIRESLRQGEPASLVASRFRMSERSVRRIDGGSNLQTRGGIYVLENDYGVKIGISSDCDLRLGDLSRSSGAPMLFSRVFPVYDGIYEVFDARRIEGWAHWLLDQQGLRVRGEWFHCHPIEACDLVARLLKSPPRGDPGSTELTSVRTFWHTRPHEAPIGPSAHERSPRTRTPSSRIRSSREVAVDAIAERRTGRPSKLDQQRRTARFVALAAQGVRLDIAAQQAGVKAERALKLVSDPEWRTTIEAIGTAA